MKIHKVGKQGSSTYNDELFVKAKSVSESKTRGNLTNKMSVKVISVIKVMVIKSVEVVGSGAPIEPRPPQINK